MAVFIRCLPGLHTHHVGKKFWHRLSATQLAIFFSQPGCLSNTKALNWVMEYGAFGVDDGFMSSLEILAGRHPLQAPPALSIAVPLESSLFDSISSPWEISTVITTKSKEWHVKEKSREISRSHSPQFWYYFNLVFTYIGNK